MKRGSGVGAFAVVDRSGLALFLLLTRRPVSAADHQRHVATIAVQTTTDDGDDLRLHLHGGVAAVMSKAG
jgi:hypothetical protein